ncbi:MAG: hypothetical protein H8E36_01660 [Rhodospirillaceae bacterium]|nr:hypothetical protein [Rhodospirillaceae bacterium]MBL6930827.1 hypothetical protein [Rhodospirillales bacterium]
MGSSVSYEVMGFKDARWSILFVTDDREEALSEAKIAEAGKHLQAVKVIRESTDDETGDERSKTIYTGGLQDGSVGSHGPSSAHKHKAAEKNPEADAPEAKGKDKLHPERVTDLIDRIRSSVVVIGSVTLLLVILAFAYLSNPAAISKFVDGFLN